MVQHLVVEPEQSESPMQSASPLEGAAQTFWAPGTSDLATQASPDAVSHILSLVQNRGQLAAGAQTLPPDP
jgi:hypothetical protein